MRLVQRRGGEKPFLPRRKRQRLPATWATATRTRATRPAPPARQPRSLELPVRTRRLREARTDARFAKRDTGAVRSAHALARRVTAGATPRIWAISPARRGTPKPVT